MNRAGRLRHVAAVAGALAAVASCAASKPKLVDFSDRQRTYLSSDYAEVYQRWTRYARALIDADVALEAWVTFKSWDYREAYVEHYSTIYSLSPTDRATLRQAQQDSFRQSYEFNVTAQSANYRWNDLEKKSSAWRVTLVDGLGHELAPEFVRVQRLPDAYETEFFPAKTPFTKTYQIRFPVSGVSDTGVVTGPTEFVGGKSGSINLRIASPIGRLDLLWQSE